MSKILLDSMSEGMATAQDENALLALINLVQPNVPWTSEHLRWQFFELPAGPARLYVIRNQGAIVSLYAAIPQILSVDGQTIESRMVQDVMTHPDFRGMGFLHHLGASCLQEMKAEGIAGHTFPNNQSEKSFRRNGWSELTEVPSRSKDVRAKPGSDRSPRIEPWNGPFDRSAAEIWSQSGIDVGVRRDDPFLNWRYAKPGILYHKFRIEGDAGLLVLKIYTEGASRTVHILDLLLKVPQRQLLPGVLNFCFEFAARERAQTVTAWLPPGHPYATYFDVAGLVIDRASQRFIFVHAPSAWAGRLENPNAWHLTQGDSDVY